MNHHILQPPSLNLLSFSITLFAPLFVFGTSLAVYGCSSFEFFYVMIS